MVKISWKLMFWVIPIGLCFFSCSEDTESVLPADGNNAYVNFVHAGEAFLYGKSNDDLLKDNCVFINDSINNPPFDRYNGKINYPFIFGFYQNDNFYVSRLPTSYYNLTGVTVLSTYNADLYWMGIEAGKYKFIYTSKNKTYLQTVEPTLAKQTYTVFYLTESPETDSTYTVIRALMERPRRKEGITGVHIIHLSPDAGAVDVVRVDATGNEISSALPQNLSFGQNTYTELSLDGTENTHGKLLLRFKKSDTDEDLLSISVPAESGAIYSLMFRGFDKQTQRKVKKDNSSYATVTVQPDLRVSVSRVFY